MQHVGLMVALILLLMVMVIPLRAQAQDSAAAKILFANPTRDYTTAPFWVWNDDLTKEQVLATLHDLAAQGVRQVFVHPRPGLMTPYLSDKWFELWNDTLQEAAKLDMNVWIYDENSYPSGFAGGNVPDQMPESRGRGMLLHEEKVPGAIDDTVLAVFLLKDSTSEDITKRVRAGESFPEGRYLIATLTRAGESPWFGGKTYVDLLYPGVTQKFLEVTMEPYRKKFGAEFGKHVPGVFTDEPELGNSKGLGWTADLPEAFEKRWGYSLMANLPSLVLEVGDWKQVRHHYYRLMSELFMERWAKPYYEYCEKNNLEFTGHYWEHGWPNARGVPDNMAMAAWQQRPGIDMLFNQYDEAGTQFGCVRDVLELNSVANQLGRTRTLCETFGGSGWEMRFEDFKRIGDWVSVLGVNTINEHLSHVSLRGARKRDYPPVFSYHTTWWSEYHVLETYFTRLSVALTRGAQQNNVLLLEPTTTAWMCQGEGEAARQRNELGHTFNALVVAMAQNQVEFDLGCEEIIKDNGSVAEKNFVVGKCAYSTVVLPSGTENLNAKTADLLEAFLKAGGTVLSCDAQPPTRIDGKTSDRCKSFAQYPGWKANARAQALTLSPKGGFTITRSEQEPGILYHQRRKLSDGELVFLVNTSNDKPASSTLHHPTAGAVEQWDLNTGTVKGYTFARNDKGAVDVPLHLEPCGSVLLFFTEKTDAVQNGKEASTVINPGSALQVRRVQPNVLTLDYVDVTAGGQTRNGIYAQTANLYAFTQNGTARNPWNHAVQFKDELLKIPFAADSGFTATYHFTIAGAVPQSLFFVAERPDLYTITCNGKPVSAQSGAWWLDRAFGKIDVKEAAQVGENTLTLKASPMTVYHEIEAAYLIGDFALKAADQGVGFIVTPSSELNLGPWNAQGCPLYGDAVSYTAKFDVAEPKNRYAIKLQAWNGSVARVTVNGKLAGHIYAVPFECDVTEFITPGANTVEVTVFGTLRNTLGPLHDKPKGITGPDSFARNAVEPGPPPGDQYITLGYGLFEPFVLVQKTPTP